MAIALDGSVTGQFTASASGAVALATLVNADEIIVAVSIAGAAAVSSVTSDQCTFLKRNRAANGTAVSCEYWYGGWSGHGTINITVKLSGSASFTVEAVGISGLGAGTVWDANISLPKATTGSSTALNSGTASTTTAAAFAIGTGAVISGATQSLTAGNVFGVAATSLFQNHTGLTASDVFGGLEYRVSSGTHSGLGATMTAGLSAAWVMMEDSVTGYTATPNPPSPPSTVQAMQFARFPDAVGAATSTFEFPPGQGY